MKTALSLLIGVLVLEHVRATAELAMPQGRRQREDRDQ
jgi:hypothetical protein